MKIIQSKGKPRVAIVCCLHGDEVFGAKVLNYCQERLANIRGLKLILANEEAFDAGVRFIDDDLNRNFPGSNTGNHEERLAAQLVHGIKGIEYVLDIHTTTSDITMTPIVANLSNQVRRIINLTRTSEVALMSSSIASHSLIGQVPGGVSLEYNEDYATTEDALTEVISITMALLKDINRPARQRKIYHITKTIPLDYKLSEKAKNFRKSRGREMYPFLLGEKAYVTHQGFLATQVSKEQI